MANQDHRENIESHPDSERRWRWRRRIALTSLVSGLGYPLVLVLLTALGSDASEIADSVSWPFYVFVGSNIGAYIGTATWEQIGARQLSR